MIEFNVQVASLENPVTVTAEVSFLENCDCCDNRHLKEAEITGVFYGDLGVTLPDTDMEIVEQALDTHAYIETEDE
jgi:hypothetical protein